MNMAPSESSEEEEEEEMVEGAGAPTSSSPPPNSSVSFQMELSGRRGRGSDEEENGSPRKKLRLSKEQSAYLEESFKEHSTLNPVCCISILFLFYINIFVQEKIL